jgi:hypothetical protein
VLKAEKAAHVDKDRVKPIPAADGIVRGRDRPVSKARIEFDRTDGLIVRAGEHSAANGTTNFSFQRESEEREDQERFHATQYGPQPQIVVPRNAAVHALPEARFVQDLVRGGRVNNNA